MTVRWTEEELQEYLKRTNQQDQTKKVKRVKNKYGNIQLVVDGIKRDIDIVKEQVNEYE